MKIHIARANLGTSAGDEYFVNDDPNVLTNKCVEDKNVVAGQDAPLVCAWYEGKGNPLPPTYVILLLHSLMPFFYLKG
jgi:hypothetical protein